MRNAGDELKCLNALNPELDDMAAAAVGNTIDRLGYLSGVFTVVFGATAGTPDSVDYALEIYASEASDMAGEVLVSTVASSTDPAAGSEQEINVDFRTLGRYVRIKCAGTVVAGTTPTIGISAVAALGQVQYGPAV